MDIFQYLLKNIHMNMEILIDIFHGYFSWIFFNSGRYIEDGDADPYSGYFEYGSGYLMIRIL